MNHAGTKSLRKSVPEKSSSSNNNEGGQTHDVETRQSTEVRDDGQAEAMPDSYIVLASNTEGVDANQQPQVVEIPLVVIAPSEIESSTDVNANNRTTCDFFEVYCGSFQTLIRSLSILCCKYRARR